MLSNLPSIAWACKKKKKIEKVLKIAAKYQEKFKNH